MTDATEIIIAQAEYLRITSENDTARATIQKRDAEIRLRRVRVCCGDWKRVLGPSVTTAHGMTAVFLDPPYSAEAGRDNGLYAHESLDVAHEVREWAVANGDNPLLRIALCGYGSEHDDLMPASWERLAWNAKKGYGGQRKDGADNDNGKRECVWFSPHCEKPMLF